MVRASARVVPSAIARFCVITFKALQSRPSVSIPSAFGAFCLRHPAGRLARRGGVKRISGLIYEETRGVLKVMRWLRLVAFIVQFR